MAVHQDVSMDERIARGGWTPGSYSGGNTNAEGYVEATPVGNAPGGKALAGWTNCHAHIFAPRIEILGWEVQDEVKNLINSLFVVDVPELRPQGRMRPLVMAAFASLLRHYREMVKDLGLDSPVI